MEKLSVAERFVAQVCGRSWQNMTYGDRDAKIIKWFEKRGWWLECAPGAGWVFGRIGQLKWGMAGNIGSAIEFILKRIPAKRS